MTPGAYPGCYEEFDTEAEGEGDEMANPLEETPELEAELDDLEAELGDSVEEQPAEETAAAEQPTADSEEAEPETP